MEISVNSIIRSGEVVYIFIYSCLTICSQIAEGTVSMCERCGSRFTLCADEGK